MLLNANQPLQASPWAVQLPQRPRSQPFPLRTWESPPLHPPSSVWTCPRRTLRTCPCSPSRRRGASSGALYGLVWISLYNNNKMRFRLTLSSAIWLALLRLLSVGCFCSGPIPPTLPLLFFILIVFFFGRLLVVLGLFWLLAAYVEIWLDSRRVDTLLARLYCSE